MVVPLFCATSYDANDSIFLLACGVMSSENYDNWSWFLQTLKILLGRRRLSLYRISIWVFFVVYRKYLEQRTMLIVIVT